MVLMSMFDLIKVLDEAKGDHVPVGGLVVALHGHQRVTMDVDVVLAMNAQQNFQLLQEIDANRHFLLSAYMQNPSLLALGDPEISRLFDPLPMDSANAQPMQTSKG